MTDEWPTFRYKAQRCPVCDAVLDAGTSPEIQLNRDHRPPQHGDITVCAYCAQVLEFDDDTLVIAKNETLANLDARTKMFIEIVTKAMLEHKKWWERKQ